MTFGYWFWFGTVCLVLGVVLLLITAKRKRTMRTVHTVALFMLLAFGGFKCARDEHTRAELLAAAPAAYTVGVTRNDGGGMKMMDDAQRVEAVEYQYTIAGQELTGLGILREAYTVERDFYPDDVRGKCVVVRTVLGKPEISRLVALMNQCPSTVPSGGWTGIPQHIVDMIDGTWWRAE